MSSIAPPKPVYLSFSAEITQQTTESLIAAIANLTTQGVTDLHLLLSTPGGNVTNGITLYNFLRGLPLTLTAHNVGNVDSIGIAIFLAASRRFACQHSTFMFHGVGLNFNGQIRLEEKMVRGHLATILNEQRRIGSILLDRTQISQTQVRKLFREAVTKDAAFAIGCGIIDEIRDVNIPLGSTVISLVFQR